MMFQGRKAVLWTIVALSWQRAGHISGIAMFRNYQRRPILLRGAVIKQDDDPMKQSPIMDVEISEANGLATSSTKSNFTGYFGSPLSRGVGLNQSVTLRFLPPGLRAAGPHRIGQRQTDRRSPRPDSQRYGARASSNRSSRNHRGKRPNPIFHGGHHAGEYRHRGKDFSSSKRGQRSLPEQRALLTGRQMESRGQFRVAGCGRGKCFSKCQGFLYCRPVPFHENRL